MSRILSLLWSKKEIRILILGLVRFPSVAVKIVDSISPG